MMRSKRIPWMAFVGIALLVAGSVILLVPETGAKGDTVVVASSSIPGKTLDRSDIKAVFLGKKSQIGGENVVVVTLDHGEVHQEFLKEVVGKTSSQFSTHWKRIVFTGKGRMPRAFKSEAELLSYVSKTKGAVGYARRAAAEEAPLADDGVKIMAVK